MQEINHLLMNIEYRTEKKHLVKPYLEEDIFISVPWLIIFLAIILIGIISFTFKNDPSADFYFITLINAIISAVIIVSCFSVGMIRFLLNERSQLPQEKVKSCLIGALIIIAFLSLIVSTFEIFPLKLDLSYKIFYVLFFILFSSSFLLFIIQSTLPNFPSLIALFFFLLLIIPLTGFLGREIGGYLGYIMGLALAQVLIFFIQWFLLSHQLGSTLKISFEFLNYLKRDWGSVLIGVFTALGIFADKIVYFIIGFNQLALFTFQLSFNYNIAYSFSLITVIPSFIYFIVFIEKGIYKRYRLFYETICNKKTLKAILNSRYELVFFLLKSLTFMLSLLIINVFLATYFAPQLYLLLGLNYEDVPLFRFSLWGNSLFILFTSISILLYYMEFYFTVILLYASFALINVLLSWLNLIFLNFPQIYIFSLISLGILLVSIILTIHYFRNIVEIFFKRDFFGINMSKTKLSETILNLYSKDPGNE